MTFGYVRTRLILGCGNRELLVFVSKSMSRDRDKELISVQSRVLSQWREAWISAAGELMTSILHPRVRKKSHRHSPSREAAKISVHPKCDVVHRSSVSRIRG